MLSWASSDVMGTIKIVLKEFFLYLYRHPRYKIQHSYGFVQKCGISNIGFYPGFRFVTEVGF